ncbi:MAG TPA: FAD-dependent oxidoreductase [Chthoniobacterales bacterium]|jgi:glycine/D-amino acid oxidase-like deaminating enzyme/nitrite reductase/ring-hydroxylating ferredoxin subunit|nr:FAD-dependent oxidoreductase [Chthoniobacterales bacterium]
MAIDQEDRAGSNLSYWEATAAEPAVQPLRENSSADVCIVGAGISGLSVAYELARTGQKVIVLDDGAIGRGMTGRTTAHIVNALDDRYYDLEKYHGEDGARMAAQSHSAAIDWIETVVNREGIECDFERLDGYLFEPPNESLKNLEKEFEACRRAGLDVEWVARAPIDDFDTHRAIRFPRQAQFHPLKYLQGLADAIIRHGGSIFTGTKVEEAVGGENAHVITADKRTVTAKAIVVASNTPINDRYVIHTKQAPYTTYVVGLHVRPGDVNPALYWDTAERAGMESGSGVVPYHYVRLAKGTEAEDNILVVGGEDHKTGQAEDFEQRFQRLEDWARVRWPKAGDVVFHWSGQVMEPQDGLGFIGRNPSDEPNVYIVTGDSGNGMTHGTIAGMLIPELIRRGDHAWAKLYDPSRITMRAAGDFAMENLNVARQYVDYFTGGEVKSEEELKPGEGAVIRRGLKKVAVYRDESGTLHEMTAICPHLKCIVHWNRTETTWDCPCHGSRFDALGKVLNGPSVADLAPIED